MSITSTSNFTVSMIRVSSQLNVKNNKMSDLLFDKLDSAKKGYITLDDISASLDDPNEKTALALLKDMDLNADAQVSRDELHTRVESLADELNTQLKTIRTLFNTDNNIKNSTFDSDQELISLLEEQRSEEDLNHDGFVTIQEHLEYKNNVNSALMYTSNLNILNSVYQSCLINTKA